MSVDVELADNLADDGDVLIMQMGVDEADVAGSTVLFMLLRPDGAPPNSPLVGAQRFETAYDVAFKVSFTPAHGVAPRLLGETLGETQVTALVAASLGRSNNSGIEAWKAAARQLPRDHPVRAAVVGWVRAQTSQ